MKFLWCLFLLWHIDTATDIKGLRDIEAFIQSHQNVKSVDVRATPNDAHWGQEHLWTVVWSEEKLAKY